MIDIGECDRDCGKKGISVWSRDGCILVFCNLHTIAHKTMLLAGGWDRILSLSNVAEGTAA